MGSSASVVGSMKEFHFQPAVQLWDPTNRYVYRITDKGRASLDACLLHIGSTAILDHLANKGPVTALDLSLEAERAQLGRELKHGSNKGKHEDAADVLAQRVRFLDAALRVDPKSGGYDELWNDHLPFLINTGRIDRVPLGAPPPMLNVRKVYKAKRPSSRLDTGVLVMEDVPNPSQS